MRVAVVGATGNAGTAVLRALKKKGEVDSILGIARRMPDMDAEPYTGCEWASIDIGASVDEGEALDKLREAFGGVDTVIHLAWLIQPNEERDLLRRVNVHGTAHVAQAAAEAGVTHLIVASSVGAYSPDPEQAMRDESWPTDGIETSHYSVDKAAQERVLDDFSAAYPHVIVTRVRPALIFQAAAASEIQRYFLSTRLPVQALDKFTPPVLPLPKGLTGVQAVHADDVGEAYALAAVNRAPGAFNICADDILTPQNLADIVGRGRYVHLPAGLVRAALAGGHKTHVVEMDEGWIDMALSVPMMDNSRAKSELGWQPTHSAADALRELVDAMIRGEGSASVPLRPRDRDHATVPGLRSPIGAGASEEGPSGDEETRADPLQGEFGRDADKISDRVTKDLVELYLSDHLTGATAGTERIERMEKDFVDTPVYTQISQVADKIRRERALLEQIIHDLGFKQKVHRQAAAWVGEHVGRLKMNNRVLTRSPMTLVLETELMRSAVIGKLGSWQALHDNAHDLGLDPHMFASLQEDAWEQLRALDEVHEYARHRAFRDDVPTFSDERSRGDERHEE
ncbi:NAD-dependent epimerase/dehydratase family protein [Flaviflexus huanghaiensis]|uniref:NAD-dependent epimerase/dehydratase family protein n=1 Tax=Flaviflexus huanghaiensis TaxID=1111473 RepID=UPI0015F7F56B|nr:NAD-dependent epimerase/dehydratase family protein [Flaviflexus huanghaiensis]